VIPIYSPKISEDLIPVLYRIGKREKKPMTKIVDGFLRDAISTYISQSKVSDVTGNGFRYQPAPKRRRLKTPVIGEKVETPLGIGEVIDVKYWKDIEYKIADKSERQAMKDRIESFLGNINRYFEYTVFYEEGDSATFDWSEYNGNFGKGGKHY
jgi:hypothetical protein